MGTDIAVVKRRAWREAAHREEANDEKDLGLICSGKTAPLEAGRTEAECGAAAASSPGHPATSVWGINNLTPLCCVHEALFSLPREGLRRTENGLPGSASLSLSRYSGYTFISMNCYEIEDDHPLVFSK